VAGFRDSAANGVMARPTPALLLMVFAAVAAAAAEDRTGDWQDRMQEVREHLAPSTFAAAQEEESPADVESVAGLMQGPFALLGGQEATGEETRLGEVVLQADHLATLADGRYEARGHVRLRFEETTIEAGSITFDQENGTIWAVGEVTIIRGDAVMHTRDVHLALHTAQGAMGRTELRMAADNYYVGAEHLEKTGDTTYAVEGGRFTACRSPNPPWEFRSDKMNIDLAGKVKARNVFFYWKGVPVLYLPYLEQNIADRRATGLLLSKPETSSRYGLTLDNAYYWVIDGSRDATFFFDIKGLEGFGVGAEYRYAAGPRSDGEVKGYRLQDDSGVSYELRADIEQHISDRTRARLNLHYLDETDDETIRGFGSGDTSRVTRNLISDAFVSQRYADVVGTANLRVFQDLVDEEEEQFQRLPELRVELPTTPVWGERLYAQGTFNATNFWRDHGSKGWRIDLVGELRKDVQPVAGVDLFARAGVDETIYTFSEVEASHTNRNRILAHTRLGGSGQWHRDYGSLTHIVEPEIAYFARLGEDSDNVPQIDRIDQRGRASQIELLLTQRVRDRSAVKDRAVLRTGAAINLRDQRPDPNDESLDAFGELTLRPSRGLSLDVETHWNTDRGKHRVSGFDLSYLKDRRWFLRTGMRWVADDRHFVTAAYGVRLSPRWTVAAEQWIDANAGELSEASISVDRTAQCYGVNVEFRYFQSATSSDQDVSDEFRLLGKIRLLNVGSVATPSFSIEREADTSGRGRVTTQPSDERAPPSSDESLDPTRIVRDILRDSVL
jgi:LPS-assembly protein